MNEQVIFNFLVNSGLTEQGAAGVMGNLRAESAYLPTNLQNYYNKVFNVTDEQYTNQVDCGLRGFIDHAGYGLAQWTSDGRKNNLFNYKKSKGCSIGDLQMQLEFLVQEMKTSYKAVWNVCSTSRNIKECSDIVLHKFEAPKDQSTTVENTRYKYAQEAYDLCAGANTAPSKPVTPAPVQKPVEKETLELSQLNPEDIVQFIGAKHYKSANASTGTKATQGPAKITKISKTGKHPVHVVHTDKKSNVYGWVDLTDITK